MVVEQLTMAFDDAYITCCVQRSAKGTYKNIVIIRYGLSEIIMKKLNAAGMTWIQPGQNKEYPFATFHWVHISFDELIESGMHQSLFDFIVVG